jgi:acetyl-CoA C-acetyltransferase
MNHPASIVLCAPVRTAIGTYAGTFKDTPGADLGASVIRAAPAAVNVGGGKPGTSPLVPEFPTSGGASK